MCTCRNHCVLEAAVLKHWASLMAQRVKQLPAIKETWVRSLGWEDPLEKEMATHSSVLAWRIPRTEKPGSLESVGSQSRTRLSDFTHLLILKDRGSAIKNLPAVQAMLETQVGTLGWKDPPEEEMVTHSSNLACKIPWTEEPGLRSMESQRFRHDRAQHTYLRTANCF